MGAFTVNLDQLDDITDEIARFDERLQAALEELDARVRRLHETWTGEAADRHAQAHAEWLRGAGDMRAALALMRQNASTALENYSGAASANAQMWRQAL